MPVPDRRCCFSALLPADLFAPLLLRLQIYGDSGSNSQRMSGTVLLRMYDKTGNHLIPEFLCMRTETPLNVPYFLFGSNHTERSFFRCHHVLRWYRPTYSWMIRPSCHPGSLLRSFHLPVQQAALRGHLSSSHKPVKSRSRCFWWPSCTWPAGRCSLRSV